jgi:hypothetical protein
MFIARSLVFYPGYFEEGKQELSDEIILPAYYLNRLMEQFGDNETLYLNIVNTNKDLKYMATIGSSHNHDKNIIYAPQWILELIGCTGNCDTVIKLEKADVEGIPVASKLVIKPLDPMAFEVDTLACFEAAFMNLHSMMEGITLPIPIPQLGKEYIMYAHIEKIEPARVCRIVEGEVDVEFINEFKENNATSTATSVASSTVDTAVASPADMAEMVPVAALSHPVVNEVARGANAAARRQQVRESWAKRFKAE